MTRRSRTLVAAAFLVAAALILWRAFAPWESASPSRTVIALGRELYAEHCASCHGDKLQGQPDWKIPLANGRYPAPPHDVTGHTWHHADALLERIVRDGSAAVVGSSTALPSAALTKWRLQG